MTDLKIEIDLERMLKHRNAQLEEENRKHRVRNESLMGWIYYLTAVASFWFGLWALLIVGCGYHD